MSSSSDDIICTFCFRPFQPEEWVQYIGVANEGHPLCSLRFAHNVCFLHWSVWVEREAAMRRILRCWFLFGSATGRAEWANIANLALALVNRWIEDVPPRVEDVPPLGEEGATTGGELNTDDDMPGMVSSSSSEGRELGNGVESDDSDDSDDSVDTVIHIQLQTLAREAMSFPYYPC